MRVIEAILYFEALGRTRLAVEDRVRKTSRGLEGSRLDVKRLEVGEVIEEPELDPLRFSALLEARVEGGLEDLVEVVARYGPTLVEILRPGRLELRAEDLSRLLLGLSRTISDLVEGDIQVPVPLSLKEIPVPQVGFDEEELWEMIYQDRGILYGLSLRLPEEIAEDTLLKLLLLEGCGVNSIEARDLDGGSEFRLEVVSPFESLFAVVFKYRPFSLNVIEPEVFDITAPELQNALSDLGSFVNSLLMGEDLQKAYERDTFSFKLV
ncbi:hypothetical protein [Thermococcus gammatolerans]|uniref:hypothetical protein n=1 Tax=Thermococcus gammatolerans TaxID=187878 RepID=UPI0011D04BCE|nr:hypothetical protein [Thermococcus gammatolerans]